MRNSLVTYILVLSVVLLVANGCGSGASNGTLSLLPSTLTLLENTSTPLRVLLTSTAGAGLDVTEHAIWNTGSTSLIVKGGILACTQSVVAQITATVGPYQTTATATCVSRKPVRPPQHPVTPTGPVAPVLTGVRIVNSPEIIRSEAPYKLEALGDYAGQSSADLSTKVSWTSESAIARVTTSGMVYCKSAGTATVSVAYQSLKSSTSFVCVLKRVTPAAGFTNKSATFDGPFASWLDVKNVYGAKGDGITDDTEAIQKAFTALQTKPQVLWFPQGTYIITKALHIINTSAFTIVGEDPRTTVLDWRGGLGETMLSLEGSSTFRLSRLGWDGHNRAAVAIHINTTLQNGAQYPTFDALEDLIIRHVSLGLENGFAGETTVNRVHFDHISTAGIRLEDFNALNFNVIDSLFTDCKVGVSNDPGAGAFNVSNSVFVRSTLADLLMGNTGPFSIRQNLSRDSNAFFMTVINGPAIITLQGNEIVNPAVAPIQIANPGPLTLIDNHFEGLPSFLPIVEGTGNPLGVLSIGNEFASITPFQGSLQNVLSYDEAPMSSVPATAASAPTETYVPPADHRSVYEVPVTATASSIQQIINQAASSKNGAVVHFPGAVYNIDETIDVPAAKGLAIVGDGVISTIRGSSALRGPVFLLHGSVRMDGLQVNPRTDNGAAIQMQIDDSPSTAVVCEECLTYGSGTAISIQGIDQASIALRVTELNGAPTALSLTGGPGQASGLTTLGRVDAFMTTSDGYNISNNGHFLIEDGWHDGGQQLNQFHLSQGGTVTQQGGMILIGRLPSAMTLNGYSGRMSLLGVATDGRVVVDAASKAQTMVAGSLQLVGQDLINPLGVRASTAQLMNFSSNGGGGPTPITNAASPSVDIEGMFAQTRTEYVRPKLPLLSGSTEITLHRVVVAGGQTGVQISSNQTTTPSENFTITSPKDSATPSPSVSSCQVGTLSMSGTWTLIPSIDAFYGLKSGGSLLSNLISSSGGSLTRVATMTDAGQRWLIRPVGDGLFQIVNRADARVLTRDHDGCAKLEVESELSSQEWVVKNTR